MTRHLARSKLALSSQARTFRDQRHALRGAIATYRTRSFAKGRADPFPEFTRRVKKCLLAARRTLDVDQFADYLAWANGILPGGLSDFDTKPDSYVTLGGFVGLKDVAPLARELPWMACRLRLAARQLNGFVARVGQLEKHVALGDWEGAEKALEAITQEFGHSFWSVQTRLAVIQAQEGLEGQKKHVADLRGLFRHGVLGFVSFYTGVRNEARMNWPHFVNLIEDRLSKNSRFDVSVEAYLRYRLLQSLPNTPSGLADILRLEHSSGLVDQYETFISVLQHMAKNQGWSSYRGDLLGALVELEGIDDFRLEKLRLALKSNDKADLPDRAPGPLSNLLERRPARALRKARKARLAGAVDPWNWIYEAVALAHASSLGNLRPQATPGLERLLASVLKRDEASVVSAGEVLKTLHNLATLPAYAALRDFGLIVTTLDPERFLTFCEVNLNSRHLGPEDATWLASSEELRPLQDFWAAYHDHDPRLEDKGPLTTWMSSLHAVHRGSYDHALEVLERLSTKTVPGFIARLNARVAMEAHIALGNRAALIDLIADEAAANDLAPAFLPIERALGKLKWADFRPHTDSLAAAIALDALWRSTDDDSVATMLRYAFTYQLKRAKLSRPSGLLDVEAGYDRARLLHYLRGICVPAIMDMSPVFQNSKDVLEERQSVCASLISIDPGHKDDYSVEIFELTNSLAVAEGLRIVDSSRIHVGTDAISRWAKRRIEPDFARYFDLVRAGVGSDGDFDQILRDVFSTLGARQLYFTPDDEADAILTDMLRMLGEEFLTNSDYGLDYFLSKRVRHQSFIGMIRGPLEFANIITAKDTEFGAYRANTEWVPRFDHLGPVTSEALQSRLDSFANEFDAKLINLKDRLLQIKSSEAPEGLFDIIITTQMLIVVRSVTQTGLGFDDFLKMVFQLFWTALETSLAAAREAIGTTLKSDLSDLFDVLRADLHALVGEDPAFSELSVKIGEVSAEVQRSLDSAANWFTRPLGQHASHKFTLRQSVEIAVQSALKSHRAFDPDLELVVDGDVELQTPDLLLITDAIFIALDNVRAHSLIKRKVPVQISCRVDDAQSQLELEVRNQVSAGLDRTEATARIDRLLALIKAGEVSKGARKEGGSGFLKIAAALRHSAEGVITFGFEEDQFKLSIRLKPTRYTVAVVRA